MGPHVPFRLAAGAAAWISLACWSTVSISAQPQQIARPADGFVLAIPAGWTERTDLGASAGIASASGTEAYVTVHVQREPAPADVSEVLARVVTKMKTSTGARVVSTRLGTFLKRRAVMAELQDDSARYRVVVIPRDPGDTSQIYYTLIAWCAPTAFNRLQLAFDSALAGFEVTATGAAAPAADRPDAQRTATSPEVRGAFFTRLLTPRPGPGVAAPSPSGDRKGFEADEAYRKGMAFAAQSAWAEAQQAFRDAEKKNGQEREYILSTAFAYLKLHKANESRKRYQGIYKNDPTNARALVGLIASAEEIQDYRDAVTLWRRYVTLPLAGPEAAEARALLAGAQELFADRYEITENPAGGAANLATPQEELQLGLQYAKALTESGVPLMTDPEVVSYVEQLCQLLVGHAKQFPTNYQLFVLDTAQVNAMTTPGFIFVYRGILDASDSEAALAGVLAHEIGHSVAHHIGKSATRSYQDEKRIADLRRSNSKLSQFLAKMLESGSPVNAQSFSRDNESQADRLAVHIAFDSGFDPAAIADLFQKFEQMSPTSRSPWDQMMQSHPSPLGRINAVKEYAALLPSRPTKRNSPAFDRMKRRLAALPQPPDATGLMMPSTAAPASTRDASHMRTTAFSLAPAPFSGEVPEGWTGTKVSPVLYVFRGPAGTGAYESGVHVELAPKATFPGKTIDEMLALEQAAILRFKDGAVLGADTGRTVDGRALRVLQSAYACPTSAGVETMCQRLTGLVEYPDYFVYVKYVAPQASFGDFSYAYEVVGNSLTYGLNRSAPVPPPDPAAAGPTIPAPRPGGGQPFTIDSPPYGGEMPQGWVSHRTNDGVYIIEGDKGTEAYEMTIRLAFYPKAGASVDATGESVRVALQKLPGAQVEQTPDRQTSDGRAVRAYVANYVGKYSNGAETPFRQLAAVVEYRNHLVMLSYVGPAALFDKYMSAFEMVGSSLNERR